MPDDLDEFLDVVHDSKADKVILSTAKSAFNTEIKAVENYAVNLGSDLEDSLKKAFKSEGQSSGNILKPELAPLNKKGLASNLFNDIGCDFRGTYFRLDKPVTGNSSIYSSIGPTKFNAGLEFKKNSSTIRLGMERKHSATAGVLQYNYDTGSGNISFEAKASKPAKGVSASYRTGNFKVNASMWEVDGILINAEKNFKLKKSDITIGGAASHEYAFVYGKIIL